MLAAHKVTFQKIASYESTKSGGNPDMAFGEWWLPEIPDRGEAPEVGGSSK
jgi:hypothetical protein